MSPQKEQILAKFHILNLQNYKCQCHLPGVYHVTSSVTDLRNRKQEYCSVSS